MGILPQGYIYPKEDRPVRDLARKRMFWVKHKTAHILSLQSLIARCCGQRISTNQIRTLTAADLRQLLKEEYLLPIAAVCHRSDYRMANPRAAVTVKTAIGI